KPYGLEELYIYGKDEALSLHGRTPEETIRTFVAQRPAWEAIRKIGGKVFVAGMRAGHFKGERVKGNFGFMGDIQNLLVAYGYPVREEAARWHSVGGKVTCYANPQGGMEQPDTYRRNYGLLLWQNDYDGPMTYAYRERWGDFYAKKYKRHNMVYPTVSGIIDTMQWEGYREGIDDVRYLTTLVNLIEKADKSKANVREAESYLSKLKDNDINAVQTDLYKTRSEIINYILKLI
ncbi:unnamed protein product, partial [marine sediment metagenome]